MTTSMTSQTTILTRKHPVDERPSLPMDPCMCITGFPSSSGKIVPVPVSSLGASTVQTMGTMGPSMGTVGLDT